MSKRGRPAVRVKRESRAVAIPIELWRECHEQAESYDTFVGRVVANRIKNGKYDHVQAEKEKEQERQASGAELGDSEAYDFEG